LGRWSLGCGGFDSTTLKCCELGALDGTNLCKANNATPHNSGRVANLFIIFITQRVREA